MRTQKRTNRGRAFIHTLESFNLSTGFKYGFVGGIAHQILQHAIFVEKVDSPVYTAELKCYADFYAQEQFCMEPPDKCPVGAAKAEDGFIDVEGARIAFAALQKALNDQSHGVSDASDKYTEEQWFFFGLQFADCGMAMTRRKEKELMDDDSSPRPQIRVNAIAQQMKGFTEAFGCQKNDRNYVTEKQCNIHASKDMDGGRDSEDSEAVTQSVDFSKDGPQAASDAMARFYELYFYLFVLVARML
uniref:Peptidase_M13 domain-containing protein n=1 Tax=Steinernema glaseri TaxID=37863 RepID=A0A1I7YJ10_9BILA